MFAVQILLMLYGLFFVWLPLCSFLVWMLFKLTLSLSWLMCCSTTEVLSFPSSALSDRPLYVVGDIGISSHYVDRGSTDPEWITDIVWTDDCSLLQESRLTTRQPHHIVHLILQTLSPSEWRTSQLYRDFQVYVSYGTLARFASINTPDVFHYSYPIGPNVILAWLCCPCETCIIRNALQETIIIVSTY